MAFTELVLFYKWSLSEVKSMPIRERRYWLAVKRFKEEHKLWQQMQNPTSEA